VYRLTKVQLGLKDEFFNFIQRDTLQTK